MSAGCAALRHLASSAGEPGLLYWQLGSERERQGEREAGSSDLCLCPCASRVHQKYNVSLQPPPPGSCAEVQQMGHCVETRGREVRVWGGGTGRTREAFYQVPFGCVNLLALTYLEGRGPGHRGHPSWPSGSSAQHCPHSHRTVPGAVHPQGGAGAEKVRTACVLPVQPPTEALAPPLSHYMLSLLLQGCACP